MKKFVKGFPSSVFFVPPLLIYFLSLLLMMQPFLEYMADADTFRGEMMEDDASLRSGGGLDFAEL